MRPILRIDTYACQTCSACQARLVCKTRAIVQYERGDLPALDAARCRGCMICIPARPFGAVRKTMDARHSKLGYQRQGYVPFNVSQSGNNSVSKDAAQLTGKNEANRLTRNLTLEEPLPHGIILPGALHFLR